MGPCRRGAGAASGGHRNRQGIAARAYASWTGDQYLHPVPDAFSRTASLYPHIVLKAVTPDLPDRASIASPTAVRSLVPGEGAAIDLGRLAGPFWLGAAAAYVVGLLALLVMVLRRLGKTP